MITTKLIDKNLLILQNAIHVVWKSQEGFEKNFFFKGFLFLYLIIKTST